MAPGRIRETTGRRRHDILDATLDALIDVGDSGTFIQEVCARAGVSVGTLYHHFGSKDRLIATLHYTLLDEYQSYAEPVLAADPPAEEGVKDTVRSHIRWLVDHPRPATFLLQQPFAGYRSDQVPAELLRRNDEFLAAVHGWLDRRMAGGEMRRLPFDEVVALLIGPVHHWVRGALYRDPETAVSKASGAAEDLAEGAWQALRP